MTTQSKSCLALVLMVGMALSTAATAQVPDNLSYQGYLVDGAGQAVAGPIVVEFALYAVDTDGTPLWSEAQIVTPTQGVFSVLLGAGQVPFPPGLFDAPLFLGITVADDLEMMPRTPLTSSAFSHKARDADTVGGLDASQLDQSAELSTLTSSVTTLTSSIATTQVDVGQLQAEVTAVESSIDQLQADVTTVETGLAGAQGDLTTVENTLPTLQTRVAQSCTSGSSIRQIFSGGTVTCETDDAGPWSFDGDAYVTGTRVGIGTSAPAAALMIDAAVDEDPFRARVASSTKLRVHNNGSVSVGTSSSGQNNGLNVAGPTGLGTSNPSAKLSVTDIDWQMTLDNPNVGGSEWYFGSSADAWAAGGGKFLIAPTNSSSQAALAIDASKFVGIGTVSPETRLHLGSGTDVTVSGGGYLTIGPTTGQNIALDSNEIMARNNGAAAVLALNAEGGQVTVNSGGSRDDNAMRIVGEVEFDNGGNSGMRISATNSSPTNALFEPTQFEEGLVGSSTRPFWRMYSREFYASSPLEYRTYSDRSLKQNIVKIPGALNTILALEGVSYELSKHPMNNEKNAREPSDEEKFARDHQLGFIAQDLEQVLPQLVSEDESSGLKTVGYMGLIPILVEAIKDQQRQIDAQWAEIESLRKRLP